MKTKKIDEMTFAEKKILIEQIFILQKKLMFKSKFKVPSVFTHLLSDVEANQQEPIIHTILKLLPYEERIIIMNDFWDKNDNSKWYEEFWSKNTYYTKKHKAINNILYYLYG